jgi:DNA polymerase elongation subunit (family B)
VQRFDRPLYGFDIETDTTVNGLDPTVAEVVAVAIALEDRCIVLTGTEGEILNNLETTLRELPPGILTTWNGAGFDLPFLHDRAQALGVSLSLRLQPHPRRVGGPPPLAGHGGPYLAEWGRHQHLDAYPVYRCDVGQALGISCGLKRIARLVGLRPVEVDRAQIHQLSATSLDAYVASDASLTRELVVRRCPTILAALDQPLPD